MGAKAKNEWFNACYEKYYDPLLARARSYAGRDTLMRNELEDLVLETFEIAWNRYDELRDHPNMMGWLTVVIRNKLDNFNTRGSTRMARRTLSMDEEKTCFIEDQEATRRLEAWYEQEEHREKIDLLLDLLTMNEREIFEEYFICRKHAPDIQRKTGLPLSSIRATIRRIRKKAKNALLGLKKGR